LYKICAAQAAFFTSNAFAVLNWREPAKRDQEEKNNVVQRWSASADHYEVGFFYARLIAVFY